MQFVKGGEEGVGDGVGTNVMLVPTAPTCKKNHTLTQKQERPTPPEQRMLRW